MAIIEKNTGPDIRPSLLLDFANSKSLDPRITFTRASTATYYDGKEMVLAEQNLSKYSQNFGDSGWIKAGDMSVTQDTTDVTAPDGTNTAAKFLATGTGGLYVYRNISEYIKAGKEYTISVYAKAGNNSSIRLTNISSPTTGAWFDLSTGTIGTQNDSDGDGNTSTITDVGGGWYRCTRTFPISEVNDSTTFLVGACHNADGSTNSTTNDYVYLWGFQIEQRGFAGAYVKTGNNIVSNHMMKLQSAASGTPRFDHDPVTGESKGLRIELGETNYITSSNFYNGSSLDTWSNGRTFTKAEQNIAPDGTFTAIKLGGQSTHDGSNKRFYYVNILTTTVGTYYCWSVYAKKDPNSDLIDGIKLMWGSSGETAQHAKNFLFSEAPHGLQSSSGTYSMSEDVGNGWYRFAVWGACTTATDLGVYIYPTKNGSTSWSGSDDFTGLYVWGAQLEINDQPTSLVPTAGSTVTRSSDLVIVDNPPGVEYVTTNIGATAYAEYHTPYNPAYGERVLCFRGQNQAILWNIEGYRAEIRHTGRSYVSATPSNSARAGKVASILYDNGSFKQAENGQVSGLNSSQTGNLSEPITSVTIGGVGSGPVLNGWVKKVAIYPKAFTDSQLIDMTEE